MTLTENPVFSTPLPTPAERFRMNDDYGYFGKKLEGYIQYMEAQKRGSGGGNGGGKKDGGWLKIIVTVLSVLLFLWLVGKLAAQ